MTELTLLLDAATGGLLVEAPDRGPSELRNSLERLLGVGQAIACAAPRAMLTLSSARAEKTASGPCVRLAGYWHGSLIEGPGRRSTAKFQGCAIRCDGFISSMLTATDGARAGNAVEVISSGRPAGRGCPDGRGLREGSHLG